MAQQLFIQISRPGRVPSQRPGIGAFDSSCLGPLLRCRRLRIHGEELSYQKIAGRLRWYEQFQLTTGLKHFGVRANDLRKSVEVHVRDLVEVQQNHRSALLQEALNLRTKPFVADTDEKLALQIKDRDVADGSLGYACHVVQVLRLGSGLRQELRLVAIYELFELLCRLEIGNHRRGNLYAFSGFGVSVRSRYTLAHPE